MLLHNRRKGGKVVWGCRQKVCQILGRMWPGWGWLHGPSTNSIYQELKPAAAVGKGAELESREVWESWGQQGWGLQPRSQ